MMDVNQLTNEEIRDQLMIYGCDPGPVVGSTRNVYANKLRRLLEGEADTTIPAERAASNAAGDGGFKSPLKCGDLSRSLHKSRSPKRAGHFSAEEISGQSKVQNTPLNSKMPCATLKTADVSSVNSRIIPHSKQSSPKSRVVQSSVPILPKPLGNFELETRREVSTVPESHRSSPKPSLTSDSAALDVISSSVKVPTAYPFETLSETYRSTSTTCFTSLRDTWENGKVSDGSDDDLRGEESSRILLPSWKEDHAYSAQYDSKQNPITQRFLDGNSTAHYSQAPRYSSGVVFENSYSGYGSRRSGLADMKKASRSYGKIGFTFLFIITTIIFVYFVVQNYVDLEYGEANKEEF